MPTHCTQHVQVHHHPAANAVRWQLPFLPATPHFYHTCEVKVPEGRYLQQQGREVQGKDGKADLENHISFTKEKLLPRLGSRCESVMPFQVGIKADVSGINNRPSI